MSNDKTIGRHDRADNYQLTKYRIAMAHVAANYGSAVAELTRALQKLAPHDPRAVAAIESAERSAKIARKQLGCQ